MAGKYRPRPVEVKTCPHCGQSFETRHKRTIYCGSSCRTLAYNARHGIESNKMGLSKGKLSFSLQNAGIAATGAAVVALGNYAINDRPAQQEIVAKLLDLRDDLTETKESLKQLLRAAQYQVDYVNAVKQVQPDLQLRINNILRQRDLEARNKEQLKTDKIAAILAKRGTR